MGYLLGSVVCWCRDSVFGHCSLLGFGLLVAVVVILGPTRTQEWMEWNGPIRTFVFLVAFRVRNGALAQVAVVCRRHAGRATNEHTPFYNLSLR